MKLKALKDGPGLTVRDSYCAEDYLFETLKYRRLIPLNSSHFNTESKIYLEGLEAKVRDQKEIKFITGYDLDLNFRDAKCKLTIYTDTSKLSEVKQFLAVNLFTSSQLSEVKGKKNLLNDNYGYTITFDLHDGEYDRRSGDKLASEGILRLVFLIYKLQKLVEAK